jgi:hypothetical protein
MNMNDKLLQAQGPRTVHQYTVPAKFGSDVQVVGMVELTAAEELMATKRAHGDAFRTAYELAKQSLLTVNGEKVSVVDGSSDTIWNKLNPKVRNLLIAAYSEIHTPEEEDAVNFLQSRTVQVG